MVRRYGTLLMVQLGTHTNPYHQVRGTASVILAKKVSVKKISALFLQCYYRHHEVQNNTPVLKLKKVKVQINSYQQT